jgi:hypothetical protein
LWSQPLERQPEECQQQCLLVSDQQLKVYDFLYFPSPKVKNAKNNLTEKCEKIYFTTCRTKKKIHFNNNLFGVY